MPIAIAVCYETYVELFREDQLVFSLQAGAWVSALDQERLEKLCRHAGRPAVADSRLVELGGGKIGYALKKRWRDGTTTVVMSQDGLVERF